MNEIVFLYSVKSDRLGRLASIKLEVESFKGFAIMIYEFCQNIPNKQEILHIQISFKFDQTTMIFVSRYGENENSKRFS